MEVREHTRKQNLFNQSFHSHNYEHWPQMDENLPLRVDMNEEMKEMEVGEMLMKNNKKMICNCRPSVTFYSSDYTYTQNREHYSKQS